MIDFVASVYGAKATRSTLSTFNKVYGVDFNFVASVPVCTGLDVIPISQPHLPKDGPPLTKIHLA